MSTKRTFVAIDLPDSIKRYLAALADNSLAEIRWIPQENIHLTIRFLGDIDEEQEKDLRQKLSKICVSPFTLEIGGLGLFPQKGAPKVLWIGLGTGHPLLFQLRHRIDDAILKTNIECEMRDFVPHLTIGRCASVSKAQLKPFCKRLENHRGPAFTINEFALLESRRTIQGIVYDDIETYRLRIG